MKWVELGVHRHALGCIVGGIRGELESIGVNLNELVLFWLNWGIFGMNLGESGELGRIG